jgi:hypothetical protein
VCIRRCASPTGGSHGRTTLGPTQRLKGAKRRTALQDGTSQRGQCGGRARAPRGGDAPALGRYCTPLPRAAQLPSPRAARSLPERVVSPPTEVLGRDSPKDTPAVLNNLGLRCIHPKMSVRPQSLPIPQIQVPSAASSSLCPEITQKASEVESEWLR